MPSDFYPGKMIRHYRQKANLSISALARLIPTSSEYLERIEDGSADEVHIRIYQKTANCLGIPIELLIDPKFEFATNDDPFDAYPRRVSALFAIAIVTCIIVLTLLLSITVLLSLLWACIN